MTQNAFSHFTEWAQGRCFNEILGCAKLHLEGLALRYDVDEYNGNKIAFSFDYYPNEDWDATPVYIEVEMLSNGHLLFDDLNERKAHEDGIKELKSDIYRILGLKEIPSNDNEIVSYWNDYVNECGDEYSTKLYNMDEENLDAILEKYDTNSIARIILNIGNDFSANRKYFYFDDTYRICTTDDIWEVINLPEFHDYIFENVRLEKYGRVWDATKFCEKSKNEILVCKMDNGDEIWSNAEQMYFALYLANTDKPKKYLYIYG